MTISIIRPVIDLETRLRDIPMQWLRAIEPNIIRGPYLPCWIWGGALDPNGYPLVWDPYTKKNVMGHRYVAKMFYKFDDEYVTRTCPRRNCLNPAHLLVTGEHPRWAKHTALLDKD